MDVNTWTRLDLEIVTALTCQVHVLSREQIHRAWGDDHSRDEIVERLERLSSCQLIRQSQWNVVPPPVNRGPVFTWKPGDEPPDAWRLSRAFLRRWHRETTVHTVWKATPWAASLFGSRAGRTSRPIERQHDLLLGEVYVLYRLKLPALAACWVGEDALPVAERGVKNPDAFLFDEDFKPRRVVESAGAYSQTQVVAFHRYCQDAQLPYELW